MKRGSRGLSALYAKTRQVVFPFWTLRQLSGPALPGRTVTGCVILRNSHLIRVAARRVRLTTEIPACRT